MNTTHTSQRSLSASGASLRRNVFTAGCGLLMLLLGGTVQAAQPPAEDAAGRSTRDLAMEDFLRTAEVVAVEPVGEGITCSKKLTLRRGDEVHHAIFKTVDITIHDVVRTTRLETCFRDCYHFEVAAYLLDRLLGIGLVPVTVEREIGGERGSVQEWIENVDNLRHALEHPEQAGRGDVELLRRRLTRMYLFDSIICNIDRNYDNILVNPREDRFYLIDHSRAFRTHRKVAPPQAGQSVQVLEPEMVQRLRALDKHQLEGQLGDLLSASRIKALVKRRDTLLKVLGDGGYLPATSAQAPA